MEKRFFWIKLRTDFFDGDEIDWLHEQPNGAEYIYIYLRLCLFSANKGGTIARQIGPYVMPYSLQKLAEITHSSPDSVAVALSLLKKIGLVVETADSTLVIPGIGGMVGSETPAASRMRKMRNNVTKLMNNVTPNCNNVTPNCNNVTQAITNCNNVTSNCNNVTKNRNKVTNPVTPEIEIEKEIEIDKKESRKKKFSFASAIDSLSISDGLKEALKAWGEMRKSIKKPLTERALKTAMNKLHSLCGDNEQMMIAVVDQSTFNDWQGFFPLKETPAQPQTDRRQKIKDAMEKGGGWNAWTNPQRK